MNVDVEKQQITNLARPINFAEVAGGVAISPLRLVQALRRQGEAEFRLAAAHDRAEGVDKYKDGIKPWEARFAQIQMGERNERIPSVFGFDQLEDKGEQFRTITAATTAVVYRRNQELVQAWRLHKSDQELPEELGFLKQTVGSLPNIEDFLALGVYAIRRQKGWDELVFDLATYHTAVRAGIERLELQGEKVVPKVVTSLNNVLSNTVFKDVGLLSVPVSSSTT
jgi:hypothetical protein